MKRQSTLGSLRRLIVVALAMVLAVILAPVGIAHGEEFSIADGDVAGLIDAINAANRNPDLDSILLAERGTYLLTAVDNETTLGSNGLPVISSRIAIYGNGARIERDSRGPEFRFFQVGDGGYLSMQEVDLAWGTASPVDVSGRTLGGAIYIESGGRVDLDRVGLSRNRAPVQGAGGAIYNQGHMELSKVGIADNYASAEGGGIANGIFGSFRIQGAHIVGNRADGTAGAIDNVSSRGAVLADVRLEDNTASHCGGIRNIGDMSITSSELLYNSAQDGGAICNQAEDGFPVLSLSIDDTAISQNRALSGAGGGIANSAPLTITNSRLEDNTSRGELYPLTEARGGAIFNDGGEVTIESSLIASNEAGGPDGEGGVADGTSAAGGGIYNTGSLTLVDVDLSWNMAIGGDGADWPPEPFGPAGGNGGYAFGGAIYNGDGDGRSASIEATDVWLHDNLAAGGEGGLGTPSGSQGVGQGGGVFQRFDTSSSRFRRSLFQANTAGDGGGAYIRAGHFNATNTTFSANTADVFGGGLLSFQGHIGLYNVTLTNNRTQETMGDGGGLAAIYGPPIRLSNSIVLGNVGGSYYDCFGEDIQSLGYNLFWESGGCHPEAASDVVLAGWPAPVGDVLRPLDDNGGRTRTHALVPGGPAIDAGNPQGCLDAEGVLIRDDQRGEARPVDGDGDGRAVCDIGAYEFQPRRRR